MDEDLLKEFIVEAVESLDSLDQDLLILESDQQNREVINAVFRKIHTIKGTCGFLELTKIEKLSHTGETLLDSIRSDKVRMTSEIISELLAMLDAIRNMLSNLEASGAEGDVDCSDLIERLKELNNPAEQKLEPLAIQEESVGSLEVKSEEKSEAEEGAEVIHAHSEDLVDEFELLFQLAQQEYQQSQVQSKTETPMEEKKETTQHRVEDQPKSEANFQAMAEQGAPAAASSNHKPAIESKTEQKANTQSKLADSNLRIDVELIDRLMNLVGELVLARNQILQFAIGSKDTSFTNTTQRLNLITSELQEGVMRTRMQPISNIWSKFPRIVRDISKLCGKEVTVVMEGEDTDLDKTIIEAIKDPLTHIIRNSVDHGIETPEQREVSGKPRQGTIFLKAGHEGGNVVIEISDDGAGINVERVRQKALEKNLYSKEVLERMSDRDIQSLIFHAGFSTAEKISNISGRGVGMDVVRSNLENIGGVIELNSTQGKGTSLRIKIPLTLAIIPALIVTQSRQKFAIPQVDLVELFRLEGDELLTKMEDVGGTVFIRLRGNLLPVVYLGQQLKMGYDQALVEDQEGFSEASITVIVIKVENQQYGLVIDEVHDVQEIVVKPLGSRLKNTGVFGGATIMGDGNIALIIDTSGLANSAGIFDEGVVANLANEEVAQSEKDKVSLLVADVGYDRRIAIELKHVNRLEEFKKSQIEWGSGHQVINYRDGLLRLINLNQEQEEQGTMSLDSELKVIVLNSDTSSFGVVVKNVVDIVDESLNLHVWGGSPGVLGSAVVQGKVTDLVDLKYYIENQGEPQHVAN